MLFIALSTIIKAQPPQPKVIRSFFNAPQLILLGSSPVYNESEYKYTRMTVGDFYKKRNKYGVKIDCDTSLRRILEPIAGEVLLDDTKKQIAMYFTTHGVYTSDLQNSFDSLKPTPILEALSLLHLLLLFQPNGGTFNLGPEIGGLDIGKDNFFYVITEEGERAYLNVEWQYEKRNWNIYLCDYGNCGWNRFNFFLYPYN